MKKNDFSKFENRYVITGKILLETPLRIGSQRPKHSISSAALLMRETPKGFVPFIPGSSLKGVLRSSCERILKTFGADDMIINEIFGSQNSGAKIRVRDSDAENFSILEERIHCATQTTPNEGFYYVKLNRKGDKPDTHLIGDEEYIPPSVSFNFCIELDNASEQDIGMILLGLDEFNYKRACIGGGVSRGYGFVSIEDFKVERIELKDFDFKTEDKTTEATKFKEITKEILSKNKTPKGEDFEVYENTIVCELEITATTNFKMRGVDENIVKVGGYAVIPGSTIKGFLRHLCYYTPNLKGKPPKLLGYKKPKMGWGIDKVDDIFGSKKQRAKILVSDAFPEKEKEKIEEGDKLKCWMIFDNVNNEDIKEILGVLEKENIITGKTSAKSNPKSPPNRNKVRFNLKKAYKFTLENFCKDVTTELK